MSSLDATYSVIEKIGNTYCHVMMFDPTLAGKIMRYRVPSRFKGQERSIKYVDKVKYVNYCIKL